MRYPKEHKAQTRAKILKASARLFRERGYDGVGVDSIMNELGLTAGGFYAHFSSKEALFAEAVGAALSESKALPAKSPSGSSRARADAEPAPIAGTRAEMLRQIIRGYLSRTHRDRVADGCPLPVLTPDVARSGDAVRQNYQDQFVKYLGEIEALLDGDAPSRRNRALAVIAQCVGGLMLARAVKDEELSNQILKAGREAVMKIREE